MSSMTTMEAWADPPGRECPMKGTHREAPDCLAFQNLAFQQLQGKLLYICVPRS